MKKLLAFLVAACLVCTLSFSSIGCGKKEEKKDGATPPADAAKDTKDKKDTPK
ncbi:MAG: hypothetical protein IT429_24910 [Gemmataceae bacterium]|nr:hypothetical protein [Gemmataceae bacterium]